MIRSRWYIIAIEIVLTLIFIPVIWYSMLSVTNENNNYQESKITSFLNGYESDYGINYGNDYYSIKVVTDADITPLKEAVRQICGVSLEVITPNQISSDMYIRIEEISFEKPYLQYRIVQLVV